MWKMTFEYFISIRSCTVSRLSKKQQTVPLLIYKAKYAWQAKDT